MKIKFIPSFWCVFYIFVGCLFCYTSLMMGAYISGAIILIASIFMGVEHWREKYFAFQMTVALLLLLTIGSVFFFFSPFDGWGNFETNSCYFFVLCCFTIGWSFAIQMYLKKLNISRQV